MRKILISVSLLISTVMPLSLPTLALAQDLNNCAGQPSGQCVDCSGDLSGSVYCEGMNNPRPLTGPDGVLTLAIQILALIVGFASVIMVTVGGYRYIFSRGDPAKLMTAKNTIIYSCIGVGIAVASQAIVVFILRRVG